VKYAFRFLVTVAAAHSCDRNSYPAGSQPSDIRGPVFPGQREHAEDATDARLLVMAVDDNT